MITFVKAFKTTDGQAFEKIEDAQKHEIEQLVKDTDKFTNTNSVPSISIAAAIIANKEKLLDILTTTPKSKPRARRINGGTKKKATTP